MVNLENDGVVVLNANQECARCFVVLGVPRGGTSMLAGALHLAGIVMGERLNEDTYEDGVLIGAIGNKNLEKIKTVIHERTERFPRWGWKQPANIEFFFRQVLPLLPSPQLLIVFRDLLAVGNRNRISAGQEVTQSMSASLAVYSQILSGVKTAKCPIMLVSYEKALLRPQVFAAALCDFLGDDKENPCDRQSIESFIAPSPAKYLANSYLLGGRGKIDAICPGCVAGWASRNDDRSLVVQLFVNEGLVAEANADKPRKDIMERGMHKTGACGYSFELPSEKALRIGDHVCVRIKGSSTHLQGSGIFTKEHERKI